MLTETHRGTVIMNPAADGIRSGAESIVKQTVLEGHAHGDTRAATIMTMGLHEVQNLL